MFLHIHEPDWTGFIPWSTVEGCLLDDHGFVLASAELDAFRVEFNLARDLVEFHVDCVAVHEPLVEVHLDLQGLSRVFLYFVDKVVLESSQQFLHVTRANELGLGHEGADVLE